MRISARLISHDLLILFHIRGTTPRIGDRDWKDVWLDSPECQQVRNEIAAIKRDALARPEPEGKKKLSTCKPLLVCRGVRTNSRVFRCDVVPLPATGCRQEEQHRTLEIS